MKDINNSSDGNKDKEHVKLSDSTFKKFTDITELILWNTKEDTRHPILQNLLDNGVIIEKLPGHIVSNDYVFNGVVRLDEEVIEPTNLYIKVDNPYFMGDYTLKDYIFRLYSFSTDNDEIHYALICNSYLDINTDYPVGNLEYSSLIVMVNSTVKMSRTSSISVIVDSWLSDVDITGGNKYITSGVVKNFSNNNYIEFSDNINNNGERTTKFSEVEIICMYEDILSVFDKLSDEETHPLINLLKDDDTEVGLLNPDNIKAQNKSLITCEYDGKLENTGVYVKLEGPECMSCIGVPICVLEVYIYNIIGSDCTHYILSYNSTYNVIKGCIADSSKDSVIILTNSIMYNVVVPQVTIVDKSIMTRVNLSISDTAYSLMAYNSPYKYFDNSMSMTVLKTVIKYKVIEDTTTHNERVNVNCNDDMITLNPIEDNNLHNSVYFNSKCDNISESQINSVVKLAIELNKQGVQLYEFIVTQSNKYEVPGTILAIGTSDSMIKTACDDLSKSLIVLINSTIDNLETFTSTEGTTIVLVNSTIADTNLSYYGVNGISIIDSFITNSHVSGSISELKCVYIKWSTFKANEFMKTLSYVYVGNSIFIHTFLDVDVKESLTGVYLEGFSPNGSTFPIIDKGTTIRDNSYFIMSNGFIGSEELVDLNRITKYGILILTGANIDNIKSVQTAGNERRQLLLDPLGLYKITTN